MNRFLLALAYVVNGLLVPAIAIAYAGFYGKYVMAYTAHYKVSAPIRSYVFFDQATDETHEGDCERVAFLAMQTEAKRRNPTAVQINFTGWSGKCWDGTKPSEPLGWRDLAHDKAW